MEAFMILSEAVAILKTPAAVAAIHAKGAKSVAFVGSLLTKHARYGERVTPGVAEWLIKMAGEVTAKPVAPMAIGSPAGILGLFAKAAERLKYPAIEIETGVAEVGMIRLAVAGAKSSEPGSVTVTSPGKFATRTFFGRITPAGEFKASPRIGETAIALGAFLAAFAAEPAKIAAEHGHKTGSCCFCARGLTTAESLAVGYGPVCAGHYGLPWGAHSPAAVAA
jgi:hypothetical protein